MLGPGEYVPDVAEGIARLEDLPKPRLEHRSRNYPARCCRRCDHRAGRYAVARRTLHDLGDLRLDRPVDLVLSYSKHYCPHCGSHFSVALSDVALPKCLYTRRVQQLAVRLVAEDGMPYQAQRCPAQAVAKPDARMARIANAAQDPGSSLSPV